jgi:hypothetical protein
MLFEIRNFFCWQGRLVSLPKEKTESNEEDFRHRLALQQNSFGATIGRLCGKAENRFFRVGANHYL